MESKIESSTVAFQTLNIAISKDDDLKSASTNFQNSCSTFHILMSTAKKFISFANTGIMDVQGFIEKLSIPMTLKI
ncbi:3661_t:CDS:2 [Gigaspora rosea]|nr:3661_t:CDS:2 [Gigaspora rosea]